MANEIPPLPKDTILLVEVGSTAHGTGVDGGEDHDELGIVIETPEQVFGMGRGYDSRMQRTQPEGQRSGPGDTDRTLHSLRKFLSLANDGNPSILLALFAPVIETTWVGDELRGKASDWFVGRHVIPKFQGYMESQIGRMLGVKGLSGHGRRGGGQRVEEIARGDYAYDGKFAMHAARLGFQCIELLETGKLTLPIQGEPGAWLKEVRYGKIPFDEFFAQALELDEKMQQMKTDESIPATGKTGQITGWSYDVHRMWWDGYPLR